MASNGFLSPGGNENTENSQRTQHRQSSGGESVSLDLLKPRTSGSRLPSLATLVSAFDLNYIALAVILFLTIASFVWIIESFLKLFYM